MLRATQSEPDQGGQTSPRQGGAGTEAAEGLNNTVQEVLRGNPAALRQLLKEITPSVRSICRGIMGRGHPEMEDAIQDCLVDVVRALPQFRFEASVSHYVTKITMRKAISMRDRARARSTQCMGLELCAVPVTTFDDGVEARANLVRDLLAELGEAQSTVVRLRFMLGHSIDEIARITGVSVNTVKTRLRLGKNRLRRQLELSGEGPGAR